MSQDYTIRDVRKGQTTNDAYTEYQSYALALEGIGEPVKFTQSVNSAAKIPEAGDTIHGTLEELDINGKTYYKLQPCKKPEAVPLTKDEVIKSEWAIGQAVQVWIAQGCLEAAYDNIEREARHFYQMINNIPGE